MISIRRQLTRELLGAVLLLLGAGFAVLYIAARDAATNQFDSALQAKARAISTLTLWENGRARVAFSDRFMPGFEDYNQRDFFQLWDSNGREIARSESLLDTAQLPRTIGTLQRPAEWNFVLPTGRAGRGTGFAFKPKAAPPRVGEPVPELQLVVASDRAELDETLWQLLALCAGVGGLLVGVTLWVIPRVLRRGLQPLDRLGDQAADIDADSLATRFASEKFPAELRPIAQRLNDLLARLEQSFERERRFSADLAHELRTPLAELRTMAECALKWPDSREPGLDRETLVIAQQMERIVTHILALARGEQGHLAVTLEPVRLDEVIEQLWRPFASGAAERHLGVTLDLAPATGIADQALLRSVVGNLLENAADYASVGSVIFIGLQSRPEGVLITIANTANELTPSDLPKLFDRFWRKETSRSGGAHLGLGLALSRAFAKAMEWTLTARFDEQRRLAFELTGPNASLAGDRGAENAAVAVPTLKTDGRY